MSIKYLTFNLEINLEADGSVKTFVNIYNIKDPLSIISILFVAAIAGIIAYFTNLSFFEQGQLGPVPIALANSFLFIVILRLVAIWAGVEINLDAETIEFPGGQISANLVTDYINPKFIFQYFGRKKIDLKRISRISESRRWGHRIFGFKINADKIYYGLNIVGNFGGATIWFISEDKCSEAYSAIRQINNMGTPINRA